MGMCTSIETANVGMIEQCGKFHRTAPAGFNCLNPFFCEAMSGSISLRVQHLEVTVETKTKDNVFVHLVVSVQYEVLREKLFDAYYRLTNPKQQITAYIFDVVRAEVPKIDLDEIFLTKDEIAKAIKDELTSVMEDFGYHILKTLITDIQPDSNVKEAMNSINAAQREKHAASDKAEATKITIVKAAEAAAESQYLQGVGIARQRMAIIDGLRDSVVNFQSGIEGADPTDVMELVLATQYFDTLKDVGARGNGTTIFVPFEDPNHGGGGGGGFGGSISKQIRDGLLQSDAARARGNGSRPQNQSNTNQGGR